MPNLVQQRAAGETLDPGNTTFGGTPGRIVRQESRNLWWVAKGDTEKIMFSLRADGVWRPFPGPADGPGLRMPTRSGKV